MPGARPDLGGGRKLVPLVLHVGRHESAPMQDDQVQPQENMMYDRKIKAQRNTTEELDMSYASLVREATEIYQSQTQDHVCEATFNEEDGWQPCSCED